VCVGVWVCVCVEHSIHIDVRTSPKCMEVRTVLYCTVQSGVSQPVFIMHKQKNNKKGSAKRKRFISKHKKNVSCVSIIYRMRFCVYMRKYPLSLLLLLGVLHVVVPTPSHLPPPTSPSLPNTHTYTYTHAHIGQWLHYIRPWVKTCITCCILRICVSNRVELHGRGAEGGRRVLTMHQFTFDSPLLLISERNLR